MMYHLQFDFHPFFLSLDGKKYPLDWHRQIRFLHILAQHIENMFVPFFSIAQKQQLLLLSRNQGSVLYNSKVPKKRVEVYLQITNHAGARNCLLSSLESI
jgi:hypothetical protein